jgi:HSP20 family molecular chaperone IbpA
MRTDDPSGWVWLQALQMLDEARRLQRCSFGATRWEPAVDVFESRAEIWLYYALPGVRPHDLEIELESGELVVRGRRVLPQVVRAASIRQLELPYGTFERRVLLPEGAYRITAQHLDQGFLVIRLQRSP